MDVKLRTHSWSKRPINMAACQMERFLKAMAASHVSI